MTAVAAALPRERLERNPASGASRSASVVVMSLFRRRPRPEIVLADAIDRDAERPPAGLWADGFGRLAIRGVQIIVLVILAIGVVYVLRQVSVVAIP